jgi:glycosyltransferase involved in cell wall biosynthesis
VPISHGIRRARDAYGDLKWLVSRLPEIRLFAQTFESRHTQLLGAIEAIQDRETDNRRELRSLRSSKDYRQAYVEDEPLVSVTIPTWRNHRALADISIPSVLAQTYQRFEIVVVGDAAPPETERAVASFGDPRIRFVNLTQRGPYPYDPTRRWYVAGVPAINEAAQLARGSWIAPHNDDDEFTPDHIEVLLATARARLCEVVYGRFSTVPSKTGSTIRGLFPPELGAFTWQAAIYHAGLRFFEMELGDAWFDRPGDWSLCRRMLLAGVRFAMVDDVVAHLYPARSAMNELDEGK